MTNEKIQKLDQLRLDLECAEIALKIFKEQKPEGTAIGLLVRNAEKEQWETTEATLIPENLTKKLTEVAQEYFDAKEKELENF